MIARDVVWGAVMQYTMKDLGYKRTPAVGMSLVVTFSCGEKWKVPAQVVADSRDANYADEEEDTIGSIKDGGLRTFELIDWAGNNMNWDELAPFAELIPQKPQKFDYEGDWCNADLEVIP